MAQRMLIIPSMHTDMEYHGTEPFLRTVGLIYVIFQCIYCQGSWKEHQEQG